MKRTVLFIIYALLFLLILALVGCQSQTPIPQEKAPQASEEQHLMQEIEPAEDDVPLVEADTAPPFTSFTEKAIRDYYAKDGNLEFIQFSGLYDYALVAYKEGQNIYYTFELVKPDGERSVVSHEYWLPVHVKLHSPDSITMVVDTFFDDGGIYNDDEFPSELRFHRSTDFSSGENPYYAPFNEKYHIGRSDCQTKLNGVRFTSKGLQLEFGPPDDEEGRMIFYAAYASVPLSGFEFDEQSHSGAITMKNTVIATKYRSLRNEDQERGAVLGLKIREHNGDTIMELELNEKAKYYNVSCGSLLEYDPFFELRFTDDYWFYY
jgi:hypothetical protein